MTDKILILVPCYNEELRLPIADFISFITDLRSSNIYLEFLDDGSTDNTVGLLKQLSESHSNISYLSLPQNVGKANAIREGVLKNKELDFEFIGFIDADLAIPLNEIYNFIFLSAQFKRHLLISAARIRLLGYSNVKTNTARHIVSRGFATVISFILDLPIYDSQCGAKLYHKNMFSLFDDKFISKWLFDVEILFRIKKNFNDYKTKIFEVPLRECINPPGSKISITYYFKAPLDLLKIYFHYRK